MEPLALAYLDFRGARRQQDFLSVKELGQRLRDGRSALAGHLVDEAVGLIRDVLFLGDTAFKLNMARKKNLMSSNHSHHQDKSQFLPSSYILYQVLYLL